MEYFFVEIGDYFIYLYSLSLIAGIGIHKRITSHTLCAVVMVIFEVLTLVDNALYNFILTLNVHSGRIVWYLSWILFNLLSIWFIDNLHARFGQKVSSICRLVRLSFFAFLVIYASEFLDRYTFNDDLFYFASLTAKSSIQLGVVVILFVGLFARYEASFSVPHGAHNRAVNWYQSLESMPPLKRARELEKWEEYTRSLPSDNGFR